MGEHLGIRMEQRGSNFEWYQGADSTKKVFTLWAPFRETTKYFQPSEKQFMINYRVVGLDQLLAQMKTAGITPVDSVQKASYGSFVHMMDPEGNKIELWEPNDVEYGKMATITSNKVTIVYRLQRNPIPESDIVQLNLICICRQYLYL